MNDARTVWRVNIPELLGLLDAGLDDLAVDQEGRVYVGDGVNGAVYRFRPGGEMDTSFDVIRPGALDGEECGLNLAVVDSTLFVADSGNERVVRYDTSGQPLGEFVAPGILSLCCAPEGGIYTLASDGDGERIDCYDFIGSRIESFCAPRRRRAHLDPELVSIDTDADGSAFVSYGMPPYHVWHVPRAEALEEESSDEQPECPAEFETWRRTLDHPEDAVLISDLAFERSRSVLWVLLARRQSGRQVLDAFSSSGEFLGAAPLPHSDNLYSAICAAGDGGLYLLDSAAGDLVRMIAPNSGP